MPSRIFDLSLLKGFTFDRLITFLKVADAGSLTEAAREEARPFAKAGEKEFKRAFESKMVQFSRAVSSLEEVLGPLVNREGKTHELTERGEQLAGYVRAFVVGLEGIESTGIEPVIRIGANSTILTWLVAPQMPKISKALPHYRFHLEDSSSTKLVNAVLNSALDFALVRGKALKQTDRGHAMDEASIAEYGYSIFAPPSMKLPSDRWEELLPVLPIATLNREGEFLEELAQNHISLTCKVGCNSFSQAKALLDTGAYAAILPDTAILACPGAQRIPLPEVLRRKMVLVWNKRCVAAKRLDKVATLVKLLRAGMAPVTGTV